MPTYARPFAKTFLSRSLCSDCSVVACSTVTYNIHEISTRAGMAPETSQALFFVHPAREAGTGACSPSMQLNSWIAADMQVWAFTVSDGCCVRHVLSHFSPACPAPRRRRCRRPSSGCAVTSHRHPPTSSPVRHPQIPLTALLESSI